jgi:hypothetical protein
VIAFLKRRWLLLSCAAGLLACTLVNVDLLDSRSIQANDSAPGAMITNGYLFIFHTASGEAFWDFMEESRVGMPVGWRIHSPQLGRIPRILFNSGSFFAYVPLWLPLSAVLGWLVLCEWRWHEKQAKECSTNDPSN